MMLDWLRRRAENIAAALLLVMFLAFLAQIVLRYGFGAKTNWTFEICVIAWIWVVLFGAAFVVRERDEIRFDVICGLVKPRTRRAFAVLAGLALVSIYGWSLPQVYDYVAFMRVERTASLGIRLDILYSIYVVFAGAAIARYLWLLWRALTGHTPGAAVDSGADVARP